MPHWLQSHAAGALVHFYLLKSFCSASSKERVSLVARALASFLIPVLKKVLRSMNEGAGRSTALLSLSLCARFHYLCRHSRLAYGFSEALTLRKPRLQKMSGCSNRDWGTVSHGRRCEMSAVSIPFRKMKSKSGCTQMSIVINVLEREAVK